MVARSFVRSLAGVGLTALISLGGFGVAAGQMPQIPQPAPMPQPAQMPQPGQMPSVPDINPGNPGDPGQQGPPQNNGQQNGGQGNGDQRGRYQSAGFIGGWCAQGDPTKQTSISYNGAFYNLTNETGDTSIGNLQGNNQIQAPGWQFVTGTLSQGGSQIQWSNGTFWARCPSGGGGGNRGLNLNGNWYPNGNRSLQCSIQQRRGNLTLQNESGQRATGSLNGKYHLTTNWQGTRINGTITRDGNRINWDNGTYWIRYRLYTQ
jgi:hypothetical protein